MVQPKTFILFFDSVMISYPPIPPRSFRRFVGAINMLGSNATITGLVQISSNTALNGGAVDVQK